MSFTLRKGRWLSLILAILSFSYIAYRLLQYHHQFSLSNIPSFKISDILLSLTAQIILLSLNLFIESKKWLLLIGSVKIVSFRHALKMVLAGFSSGIITPAKLGEPLGRALFLKKEFWAQTTLLTYLGGTISNLVVFTVALPCVLVVYQIPWFQSPFLSPLYLLFFLVLVTTFLIVWYKKQWFKKNINRFKALQTIKMLFYQIASTPKNVIIRVFGYSLLRFTVYSFQLAIMLWLMGAHITAHTLMLIPIYFMLVSMAPTFFLAELGIRGSVALFIFAGLNMSATSIVLAVTALWILNQMLPALLGIVVIWQNKGLKNNNRPIPA